MIRWDQTRRFCATVVCPACGDRAGRDYRRFADHLYQAHGPEDFGMKPHPGADVQTRIRGWTA